MIRTLFFSVLTATALQAQTPAKDLQEINSRYARAERIDLSISYQLFLDDETKAQESSTGFYKKLKDCYHMNQGGNEVLMTEKHLVVIDRGTKTVILDRRPKTATPPTLSGPGLDSLMKGYEKVQSFTPAGNSDLKGYTFTLRDGVFSRIEVLFEPGLHRIAGIGSTYRKKMDDGSGRLRVTTLKMIFKEKNSDQLRASEFDVRQIVSEKNGKLVLTKTYQGYTLLTNLKAL